MLKPNGYDEARTGDFTPVELGGHYAVIKQVTEMTNKNGAPMIVVLIDFADNDKQPKYHSTAFKNDDRQDKKWPFNGSKYINVRDYNDPNKTSSDFKRFCKSFEHSNNCEVQWMEGGNWGAQFKNKRIGVVYGEEENEFDGKISMRHSLRWFCSWDKVKDQKVPNPKYLPNKQTPAPQTGTGNINDYVNNMTSADEEEIPF